MLGKEYSYETKINFVEYNIEHYLRFFGTRLTEADLAYKQDVINFKRQIKKIDRMQYHSLVKNKLLQKINEDM